MNDCNLCQYMRDDTNLTLQSCSKWVNSSDFGIPCSPSGGNPGDPPGTNDNCQKLECPAHCQYPYTKGVYNTGVIPDTFYDSVNQTFPAYRFLNENPTDLDSYVSSATNRVNIKSELLTYDNQNVPQGLDLKCGALVSPESDGDTIEFPEIPSESEIRETVTYNIGYLNLGINWSSIKRTDKLNNDYASDINETDNTVTINGFTIPIADNGIELEWWDRTPRVTDEQLKTPLPIQVREYQTLENIHQLTGGILEMVFPNHTRGAMVIEEVYDWLMKNNLERDDNAVEAETKRFTMANFFGVTTDEVTNRDFEICINQLMITEHDDDEYLRRINTYTNLTDLGDPNNRKDLLYVEAKIIKFLILDVSKVGDCLDIVYLTDGICEIGLTSNATQMMGRFLKMNTDNVDDEKYDDKMRILTKRLLKHLPNMIQKIIDMAEYYEKQKCNGELHKNTKLLKEIYNNLFTKNTMKIELPSLGIGDFFRDFEQNIFTKIILLLFIAYVVTQFIRLFTVNVNLSGGK
jgi:hypothetical protein